MEKEIKKISYKVLTLVLCLCIVSGAAAPAYATSTDPDISYFVNNGYKLWSGPSGSHTFQNGMKLGDIVSNGIQYLSLDLQAMYSGLNQLYTSVTSNGTNISNIYTIFNGLMSGWYSADSVLNPPNAYNNSWYWRVLQALGSLQTAFDDDSIIYHLSTINNKLSAWTGTTTLDIGDMTYEIMKNSDGNKELLEQTLSGGAITSDWHWNDNGTWRAVGANTIPVINRNSDGQLYLNVYPYEASNLSIKGLLQAMIRNQFYSATAIRGTYENNRFAEYTSSGAIQGDFSDNVIKSIQLLNNNVVNSGVDNSILLSEIKDEYKDITWNEFSDSYQGVKTSVSGEFINSATDGTEFYFFFKIKPYTHLLKLDIPLQIYSWSSSDADININVYNLYNNTLIDIDDISFYEGGNFTPFSVYAYSDFYRTPDIVVEVISSKSLRANYRNTNGAMYYHEVEDKDYLDFTQNIFIRNINNLFEQAKYVFFDDKTIAAKKDNQSQEDTFLNNFTGSASASASPSDFRAVKDSIVDFKAGFSGGASSSDTFSFISGDSNAWDWFTQEIANDLDRTQGNNTRLLRGSSDVAYDTPLLDSYYTSILSILGGE